MAYIDPNTGGMLFQILAASFALLSGAVLIFSRKISVLFARFKRFLRDRFGSGEPETEAGPETEAAVGDEADVS